MPDRDFYVKFWGVRGSIPVAGERTSKFGGNTPCLEVVCGDRVLMLDSGSGAFSFGEDLKKRKPGQIDVFFTHCHYDHVEGVPFFAPVMDPNWHVSYWAGHLAGKVSTADMLKNYMKQPYFPIGTEYLRGCRDYHDFMPGDVLDIGDGISISTCALNHPDGAVGYRVEYDGRSLCYITDMEHREGEVDQDLETLVSDTGIMIYDAMFSDEEYPRFKGWGHSTWQEGARLSDRCNVGRYVAFHHQPAHNDETLENIEKELQKRRPGSLVAREGMVLEPEK